jgi:hypothetical protein
VAAGTSSGAPRRSVVVTGYGATTPLGGDVPSTWEALLAGRSGVSALTQDWAAEMPVKIAASIAVDPSQVLKPVEVRRLDRSAQFALIAAREAWKHAGLTEHDVVPERLGSVVGSGIGGVITLLDAYDVLKAKGARSHFGSPFSCLCQMGWYASTGISLDPVPGGWIIRPERVKAADCLRSAVVGGDERHRVADGGEVLDLFVRDLHAELLLGGDDDLDHGERVDVEVLGEGLVQLDVLGRDSGDLVDDFGESGEDLFLSGGHVWRSLPVFSWGYPDRLTEAKIT